MDDVKLLDFKISNVERNFLNIIKDINKRLNIIEDLVNNDTKTMILNLSSSVDYLNNAFNDLQVTIILNLSSSVDYLNNAFNDLQVTIDKLNDRINEIELDNENEKDNF